jgi:hypothetical protein
MDETTWLRRTFVVSMMAQIFALLFSGVALAQEDVPETLRFILVLGVVVASIQFVWYCSTFVLVFVMGNEDYADVKFRYIDWFATTGAPRAPRAPRAARAAHAPRAPRVRRPDAAHAQPAPGLLEEARMSHARAGL